MQVRADFTYILISVSVGASSGIAVPTSSRARSFKSPRTSTDNYTLEILQGGTFADLHIERIDGIRTAEKVYDFAKDIQIASIRPRQCCP
jgi:hypothetical protein